MKRKLIIGILCGMAIGMVGCGQKDTSVKVTEIVEDENTNTEDTINELEDVVSNELDDDLALEESLPIYGEITSVSVDEQTITVDNQSNVSSTGEMILTIDPDSTYIIDATTGLPVDLANIQVGSFEAYLSDVMTMSLPPQCTPTMVLVNVKENAPKYVISAVNLSEISDDNTSMELKGVDGSSYTIDKDVDIVPYLTKNIVKLEDIVDGTECLVWQDDNGTVTKVMILE